MGSERVLICLFVAQVGSHQDTHTLTDLIGSIGNQKGKHMKSWISGQKQFGPHMAIQGFLTRQN